MSPELIMGGDSGKFIQRSHNKAEELGLPSQVQGLVLQRRVTDGAAGQLLFVDSR